MRSVAGTSVSEVVTISDRGIATPESSPAEQAVKTLSPSAVTDEAGHSIESATRMDVSVASALDTYDVRGRAAHIPKEALQGRLLDLTG
ncbi:MAG: hypothetical protein VX733_05645 [Candidatus Latescibacterota bacterium]|nr:hypothetical protein [Candidatus Latescibacterota bacterium]